MSEGWNKNKHRVLQRKTTFLKKFIRSRKKDLVTRQIWLKVHLDSVAKGGERKCNIQKKIKKLVINHRNSKVRSTKNVKEKFKYQQLLGIR